MKKAHLTLALALTSALLASCGGGGSAASTEISADASEDTPSDTENDLRSDLQAPESPSVANDDGRHSPSSGNVTEAAQPFAAVEPAAPATRYLYVSTAGADDNPGTKQAPLRTIKRAASLATPGTTVYVAPGTYPGGFVTTASGTAQERIRYVSSTRWGARIVPPKESRNNIAWRNRGDYVDIVAFEIDGQPSQAGTKWRTGISAVGSYNLVQNNHVHHIAQSDSDCTSNGGSGINSNNYYHGYHNAIVGNFVHHIGPENCKFISGIYMSTSGQVQNNVVYRNGNWGIQTWHDAADINISNNTVAYNGKGILVGGGGYYHLKGPADRIIVANNIVSRNSRHGIAEMGKVGDNNTYVQNLSYGNGIDWMLKKGHVHTGDINAEPLLVDAARGDFRLSSGSPAIDRALSIHAPQKDVLGVLRPQAGAPDLGAYEYR